MSNIRYFGIIPSVNKKGTIKLFHFTSLQKVKDILIKNKILVARECEDLNQDLDPTTTLAHISNFSIDLAQTTLVH